MKKNRTTFHTGKPRKWISRTGILLAVVLLLLGMILAGEYTQIRKTNDELDEIRTEYAFYAELLAEQETKNETLETSAADISTRLYEEYERILEEPGNEEVREEWLTARMLAGFTEVSGEGIVITLNDAENGNALSALNIIHDADVQHVVDSLRAMGAVAISINGERILHTSELTCNGPTILINNRYHPVPYVISAVGDAETMFRFFNEDKYLIDRAIKGIQVKVQRSDELTIPGYSDLASIESQISLFEVTGT